MATVTSLNIYHDNTSMPNLASSSLICLWAWSWKTPHKPFSDEPKRPRKRAVRILIRWLMGRKPKHLCHQCLWCFSCLIYLCVVLFTQPPMRRMRICFTDVFFCFLFIFLFFAFSVRHKNTRQPFSGTAERRERIFMKLLPNNSGENVVSKVVQKWGLGPQIILWG